jgi:hypothetical protein
MAEEFAAQVTVQLVQAFGGEQSAPVSGRRCRIYLTFAYPAELSFG